LNTYTGSCASIDGAFMDADVDSFAHDNHMPSMMTDTLP